MHYSTYLLRHTRRAIGRNIYQQRLRYHMTLEKLARLADVPLWQLDQYEIGKNEIKLDELLRIACVFSLGVEKLFV